MKKKIVISRSVFKIKVQHLKNDDPSDISCLSYLPENHTSIQKKKDGVFLPSLKLDGLWNCLKGYTKSMLHRLQAEL